MNHVSQKKHNRNSTLLVIEDYDILRKILVERLGMAFEGWMILEAKSGEEAVSVALARQPDIILMDIGLAQMKGIEATRRIKAALPSTDIIILSIHDDLIYRAKAEAAGASRYVAKGDMDSRLISTIQELLPQDGTLD